MTDREGVAGVIGCLAATTANRWQVAGGLPSRGQGRCTVCDSNYKTMWMYWVGKVLEVLNVRLEI